MAVCDLCLSPQLTDQTADGAFTGAFLNCAGGAAFLDMLTSVQSTHKTTDPVGCRHAAVRCFHCHVQICHMTVLDRTTGRAGERTR